MREPDWLPAEVARRKALRHLRTSVLHYEGSAATPLRRAAIADDHPDRTGIHAKLHFGTAGLLAVDFYEELFG